jgi:SAM-dependent methyltransferase
MHLIGQTEKYKNLFKASNVENAKPLEKGRKFDLIVSFVTFIWLTDPIGTFEMVYNEFLNPGGLFLIGDLACG